ncbi:hypothetical protein Godav_007869 [Gossypium davidsonii]|uniref:Uncharacterized protein n=1 Tax=Gossypium davidsonii TaxID=34287 RepID=A0A7J8S883_GOSDV|nr:hypothetical protein [Gossypium davidsonii]
MRVAWTAPHDFGGSSWGRKWALDQGYKFGDGVQVLCYRGITFRMVEFCSTVHRVAANLLHQEQAAVHMPMSEYGGAQVMSMMHPQGHHALKQPAMAMELTRQSMRVWWIPKCI